jgi:hypothetical protein
VFLYLRVFLLIMRRSLVIDNVDHSSPILVILIMEAIFSSETSALRRTTKRNIAENGILHIGNRLCFMQNITYGVSQKRSYLVRARLTAVKPILNYATNFNGFKLGGKILLHVGRKHNENDCLKAKFCHKIQFRFKSTCKTISSKEMRNQLIFSPDAQVHSLRFSHHPFVLNLSLYDLRFSRQ